VRGTTTALAAALAVAAALVAVVVTPAGEARRAAPTGSIVFAKGGKLWIASPDGRVKRRIPHAGAFESPSQADNGTIVAQRGLQFFRLDRSGRALGTPISTAYRTNPVLKDFKGPFWPEVSPDGTRIAYTYFFQLSHYDPSCACTRVTPSLNTAYTYANREVPRPDTTFGNPGFYSKASWIDNRNVLLTTQSFVNFSGTYLDSAALHRVGAPGDKSYRPWFSECAEGCEQAQTARLYHLGDGELNRQRSKAAFVSGALGDRDVGSQLLIYALPGAPPARPSKPCHYTQASGKISSPTWSPDGTSLAWADRRGIWVARVADVSGETCRLERRLLVPGGVSPDWGPAAVR
jgi:hypothetical protein